MLILRAVKLWRGSIFVSVFFSFLSFSFSALFVLDPLNILYQNLIRKESRIEMFRCHQQAAAWSQEMARRGHQSLRYLANFLFLIWRDEDKMTQSPGTELGVLRWCLAVCCWFSALHQEKAEWNSSQSVTNTGNWQNDSFYFMGSGKKPWNENKEGDMTHPQQLWSPALAFSLKKPLLHPFFLHLSLSGFPSRYRNLSCRAPAALCVYNTCWSW